MTPGRVHTALLLGAFAWSVPSFAFTFAEGYSSATPGAAALLYYRAFTTDEGREGCDTLSRPTALRMRLPSTKLKVGDRIHRMNSNPATRLELIVEARDGNGALVPNVPIVVEAIAQKVEGAAAEPVTSSANQDYLEAVAPGAFTLKATIYCDYAPVSAQLPLTIEE